jgi:hypothetical protein
MEILNYSKVSNNNIFIVGLVIIFTIVVLLTPSIGPMMHPDSSSYLKFSDFRSAFYPVFLDIFRYFGLTLAQIIGLQIFIFSLSVYFLLMALSRICNKKVFILIYIAILSSNIWFTSLHKYILTESIYISLNIVAIAALIIFLFKGATRHIFIFSLMTGLAIGVRPSGVLMLMLMPIILISAYNRFNLFRWKWVFALVIPIVVAQILELTLYRAYHGDSYRPTIMNIIMFGKGAMVNGDFEFYGPHKEILHEFSNDLDSEFGQVNVFIDEIPYFWLKNQSLPNYEIYAQFKVLVNKKKEYAEKSGISKDEIMLELGGQRISQEIGQWVKNSLYYYAGSWGLRVTTFPFFVDEYNDWVLNHPNIPLNDRIPYLPLKGDLKPSIVSLIAFPALLFAGIISGVIGLMFLAVLFLNKKIPLLFMLSGIISIGIHGSLLFSSFVNVATPRYTTTQFPMLVLVFLLMTMWILPIIKSKMKLLKK